MLGASSRAPPSEMSRTVQSIAAVPRLKLIFAPLSTRRRADDLSFCTFIAAIRFAEETAGANYRTLRSHALGRRIVEKNRSLRRLPASLAAASASHEGVLMDALSPIVWLMA
jgi:hypothetical protein